MTDELLKKLGSDPTLLYGDKRYFSHDRDAKFVPAHVAFDKVVNQSCEYTNICFSLIPNGH